MIEFLVLCGTYIAAAFLGGILFVLMVVAGLAGVALVIVPGVWLFDRFVLGGIARMTYEERQALVRARFEAVAKSDFMGWPEPGNPSGASWTPPVLHLDARTSGGHYSVNLTVDQYNKLMRDISSEFERVTKVEAEVGSLRADLREVAGMLVNMAALMTREAGR